MRVEDQREEHSFGFGTAPFSVLVVGASGGIGQGLTQRLMDAPGVHVVGTSRTGERPSWSRGMDRLAWRHADLLQEDSLQSLAPLFGPERPPLRLVLNATGFLHGEEGSPEKRLAELEPAALLHSFRVNTIGPMLVAKHLIPVMPRKGRVVYGSLGARVGSIEDNRLGGWYGYRASKAALNQFTKTLSIEWRRRSKESIAVALHPGTVATDLSAPFAKNVPPEKLFPPLRAAEQLLTVVSNLTPMDSGTHIAWDGVPIPW